MRVTQNGQPLPELVDFRITPDKRKAILFVQEGERHYRKHLDLTKAGAGLWMVFPGVTATFIRRQRVTPESAAQPFERVEGLGLFALAVSEDMAELLALIFWGHSLNPEGVPAAQSDHLNAAD